MNPRQNCPANASVYTIKAGDTFYSIARTYGVTLEAILAANPGVNPDNLRVGQTICIPGQANLTLVSTPCCLLLKPVFANLPPAGEIPVGAVVARKVAMSTSSYTFVVTALPEPSQYGNYDMYIGRLSLYPDTTSPLPEIYRVRLIPTQVGNQQRTWAGTIITAAPPVRQGVAEIRPFNSISGVEGTSILLNNQFAACCS